MNQMNKNKGFSLIELLIAITLLSVVMIMVTQFMGTTSGALSKTKKNLNLQTEAMEVGEQLSDTLAQATYIRVCTQDQVTYTLDNQLDNKRKKRTVNNAGTLTGDLVVDNYPNFLKNSVNDRKIILNDINYTLVDSSGKAYPQTGDEDTTAVQSFRKLTSNNVAGEPLYVKPKYVYIRYQKKINGTENEAYAIYYFDGDNIYMNRGDLSDLKTAGVLMADGYKKAVDLVNAKAAKTTGENGLLTKCVSDCYLSADSEENTIFLDILLKDPRYDQYIYNYTEAILLRNSNVLTVVPQKMFKKK